jgi:hypothetical protein
LPPGATLGGFHGMTIGIGPQVGFIFPNLFEGYRGYLNVKAYADLEIENRPKGWTSWVTFQISPQASDPPATKTIVRKVLRQLSRGSWMSTQSRRQRPLQIGFGLFGTTRGSSRTKQTSEAHMAVNKLTVLETNTITSDLAKQSAMDVFRKVALR